MAPHKPQFPTIFPLSSVTVLNYPKKDRRKRRREKGRGRRGRGEEERREEEGEKEGREEGGRKKRRREGDRDMKRIKLFEVIDMLINFIVVISAQHVYVYIRTLRCAS